MDNTNLIDLSTEFGRRVQQRLRDERIGWLTTVSASGRPYPRPVWFLWDGQMLLIFSRPKTHKITHIGQNPNVAFNLDGDGMGGDIVVLQGEAWIDPDMPPADENPAYTAKYQSGFERINMTAAEFAAAYSVPIRVRPTSLRGH